MPELRLNLITKEWVIIATERAKRPEDFITTVERKVLPPYVETCPFCSGNEAKTPDEVFRLEHDNQWLIRIVPNKFSALSRTGQRERINDGLKHNVSGVGVHDVLIETPMHNLTTAFLPTGQIENIIGAYRRRFMDIYNDPRIEHVIIFKNHGEGAGTSLQHPHSQIIGTPLTAFHIRDRLEQAMRFFDTTGQCLMCKTIEDEKTDGIRVILETEHFITFIPYAALSAFHIWIFPKRHFAAFSDITGQEIADLAGNLKTTLSKLYYGLDNPDFNYVIRSNSPEDSGSEYFHWYISIVPRVSKTAGFELGSGMYINTALPEQSAEFLRNVTPPVA